MPAAPRRLTYANVVSTLALVVALGGGGAAVAMSVAKNSVGSPQIKNGQVKAADLAANGVTSAKIKNGQVTGADVDESTLGTVPSAGRGDNLLAATVQAAGTLVPGQSVAAVSSAKVFPGSYEVIFDRNVTGCAYSVTQATPGVGDDLAVGYAAVTSRLNDANGIFVQTFNASGVVTDRSFMVLVAC